MSANKCIFCGNENTTVPSSSLISNDDDKGNTAADEHKPNLSQSVSNSVYDRKPPLVSCVEEQLKIIFIVRKLLKVPTEKCVKYLECNDGVGHPNSWFSVCGCCNEFVKEGYRIYTEIELLKKKFGEVRTKLKDVIITSYEKPKRGKRQSRDKNYVYHDVRKYIISENSLEEEQSLLEMHEEIFIEVKPNLSTDSNDSNPKIKDSPGSLKRKVASNVTYYDETVKEEDIEDDALDLDWEPSPSPVQESDIPEDVSNNVDKRHVKKKKICGLENNKTSPVNENVKHEDNHNIKEEENKLEKIITTPPKRRTVHYVSCDFCVAYFKTVKELTTHHELHERGDGTPCPHCGWMFMDPKNVRHHIIHRHKNLRVGPSRKRGRKPRREIQKKYEYNYEFRKQIPYYCDNCPLICVSKLQLLQHRGKHHSNIPNLSCSLCNNDDETPRFETRQLLEMHYMEQHPTEEKAKSTFFEEAIQEPQMCEDCPMSFPTKLRKDFHRAKFHKEMLLKCEECGHKSSKYCNYLEHQRTKHRKGKFMCENCARTFSSAFFLRCHMKADHHLEVDVKLLTCAECHMTFPFKLPYQRHMENVHQKKKRHCCEFCGKAFAWGCDLRKHILLHTAPREKQYKQGPFFCEYCQAKFNVRQALYYHLKRKHSDKYSFKCDGCGVGYLSQNTLLQHKRKCKIVCS